MKARRAAAVDNKYTGSAGEAAAANYLISIGWQILATNWETEVGELDIVARDGQAVVFIEVKTRSSYKFGRPAEAVGRDKQYKLSMMAAQYIKKNRLLNIPARFDVIEVTAYAINHIRNAFESRISF